MRRLFRFALLGTLGLSIILLGLTILERMAAQGDVLAGVRLLGVDTSGTNAADLRHAIQEAADDVAKGPIELRAGSTNITLRSSQIGIEINQDKTLERVARQGRRGNPLGQLAGTLLRRFRDDEVDWVVRYDSRPIEFLLTRWSKQLPSTPKNGGLQFKGTDVVVIEPVAGIELDEEHALDAINTALRKNPTVPVPLPVKELRPTIDQAAVKQAAAQARRILLSPVTVTIDTTALTLEPAQLATALRATPKGETIVISLDEAALRAAFGPPLVAIETQSRDASFAIAAGGAVQVVPSVAGSQLNISDVSRSILSGNHAITGLLRTSEPDHNTAWASSLNIVEKVSEFTTKYPPGQARVKNIHRASELLQGRIIEPGERFSLNQTVGPRTQERGFVRAPVIYDGEFSEDVGGGVSQFATTFYNAIFFGGYKIVTHQAHSFYIDRYPMGREATISVPSPDLVFVNDRLSGILVRTSVNSSSVTVAFYGAKEGRAVQAEGPRVLAQIEPGIDYTDDPLLPTGIETITAKGRPGFQVEVFRIITTEGQEPKRQRFVTRYKPQNHKVTRGTGLPAATTTTVPAPHP